MTTSLTDSVAKGLALAAWIPLKEEGTAIAPEFSLIRKGGDFILTGKFGRDHLFPELVRKLEDSHDETLTVPELSNLLTGLKDDVTASLDDNQNDESSGLNGLKSYVDSFRSCFSSMANIHFNEVEFSACFGQETNPLTGNIEKTTSVMFALETEWLAIQIYFKKSVAKINGVNQGSSKVLLLAKPINEVELRNIVPLTDPSVLPDFSLDACFVCSSVPLNGDEVSALMVLKPGGNAAQPLFSGLTNNTLVNSLPGKKLNVGVALLANIKLNDIYAPLYIPMNPDETAETQASGQTPVELEVTDEQPAIPLKPGQSGAITGKKLGPITVSSVSFTYADPCVKLSVDGTLSMASFQLILDALVLNVDLDEIFKGNIIDALSFELAGLSLFIDTSSFSLAGSLFRIEGEEADEYLGRLSLSTKTLSLGALGAYTKLPSGQTSMFAYLAINYPIGGIPAFFVEGLALGFGYNRAIKLPAINKVHQFPLVTSLNGGQPVGGSVDADSIVEVKAQLKALSAYLPACPGQNLIAAGIRFSTFKLIDSIAVLMVEFGNYLGVHLVGVSGMSLPAKIPNVTPVANIEMSYRVSFLPDAGILQLEAALTDNSYVLSKDCKLQGGFAYYSWFKGDRAGDFAVSMGGYHPRYNKPAHYPDVKRLGFRWQVTDNLSMKGGMYAALTPAAIMAGGGFQANYDSGRLSAWFNTAIDFIMYWQPFYYEADFLISLGARVEISFGFFGSISFSASLGAAMSVWGPDFAGKAVVNWSIFEFTIYFGDQSSNKAPAISWDQFNTSYIDLNQKSAFTEMSIVAGEIALLESAEETWHLVDPDQTALLLSSPIPINTVNLHRENDKANTLVSLSDKAFYLGPTKCADAVDNWTMDVTYDGPAGVTFSAEPVMKNYPKAIWWESDKSDMLGSEATINLLSGMRLVGDSAKSPGFTDTIDADEFAYLDVQEEDCSWQWGQEITVQTNDNADENIVFINTGLEASDLAEKRRAVADFFADDTVIDLLPMIDAGLESAFIGVPQTLSA